MNIRQLGRKTLYKNGLPFTVRASLDDVASADRAAKDLTLAARDLGEKVEVNHITVGNVVMLTVERKETPRTAVQKRHDQIKKWGEASTYHAHIRERRQATAADSFTVRHFGYKAAQAHKIIARALRPEVVHIKSVSPEISEVTIL